MVTSTSIGGAGLSSTWNSLWNATSCSLRAVILLSGDGLSVCSASGSGRGLPTRSHIRKLYPAHVRSIKASLTLAWERAGVLGRKEKSRTSQSSYRDRRFCRRLKLLQFGFGGRSVLSLHWMVAKSHAYEGSCKSKRDGEVSKVLPRYSFSYSLRRISSGTVSNA